MVLPFKKNIKDENETLLVAEEFSHMIKVGEVVCLNGDLGSGKTFFVKSVCKYFDIDTAYSPSFGIVNEYSGGQKIVHLDFYRLKKVEELYDIGFEDYLSSQDSIVFIEWSDMFKEVLPKKYYQVNFNMINETEREIEISKHE